MVEYADYSEVKAKKPVRRWHEAIIDDLLINPLDSLKVRGARLGYSESYLSVILNTDMFKAAYAIRREEYQKQMDLALVTKTTAVAAKGLDIMLEVLEQKRTQIPFGVVSDAVDKTLQRLGYGVKPAAPVNVNVGTTTNVAVLPTVSAEQLAEARQALRAAEASRLLEPPTPAEGGSARLVNPPPESGDS